MGKRNTRTQHMHQLWEVVMKLSCIYIHTRQYDLLFIVLTALALDLDPLATTTHLCLNATVADPYTHISSNPLLISLMEANPTFFHS